MTVKYYCESKLADENDRKEKKLQDAEKKGKDNEAYGKEKQPRNTNKKTNKFQILSKFYFETNSINKVDFWLNEDENTQNILIKNLETFKILIEMSFFDKSYTVIAR